MRLKDRIAIVVGAGQSPGEGIGNGRATALTFAREGAKVLCIDHHLASAQETVDMIAGNCAVLLSLLRSANDVPSAHVVTLAQTALRLRLIAVGFWLLLWLEYVLPHLEIRPLHTIKRYEDLWRNAQVRLDVKMTGTPVIAG